MTGSIGLFVLLVATGAALAGLWAYSRQPEMSRSARRTEPGEQIAQWGVRIAAATGTRACPRAQILLGKEFPVDDRPRLPLPDCPYPQQCECGYIKLFERRHHGRRSQEDPREVVRFEGSKPPRRSGKDRRKTPDIYDATAHL
jgi:hypothetical protein